MLTPRCGTLSRQVWGEPCKGLLAGLGGAAGGARASGAAAAPAGGLADVGLDPVRRSNAQKKVLFHARDDGTNPFPAAFAQLELEGGRGQATAVGVAARCLQSHFASTLDGASPTGFGSETVADARGAMSGTCVARAACELRARG